MVYLYGASGHAKVVLEVLESTQEPIGGIIDDNPNIHSLLNYSVDTVFPDAFKKGIDEVIISIGNNVIRKKIAETHDYKFSLAIHPSVNISPRTHIGYGTVIMAGVSINSDSRIGCHVILNTNCSVDHDCLIGDYAHISPNVALAGNVTVGEGTHVGIGASIIQGIKIGKWCTIGAGAVIIKNVPDGATVVGNPGRVVKI